MPTLDQAKTMWCPFGRCALPISGAGLYETRGFVTANRDSQGVVLGTCIGDACMSWRWLFAHPPVATKETFSHPVEAERLDETPPPRPAEVPPDFMWVSGYWDAGEGAWVEPEETAKARALAIRQGYCGLAGRPVLGGDER